MFEKPRCKCPRCVARRRVRYFTVSGVCAAITVGYFTFALAERRETVPDLLLDGTGGPADLPISDLTPIPAGNSAPIAESPAPRTNGWQTVPLIEPGKDTPETPPEKVPQPDGANIATAPPESSSEPSDSELSFRVLVVTSTDKNVAMAYDSDPYGVFPPWLIQSSYETPWNSQVVSANESESVAQNQEKATDEPSAAVRETSPVVLTASAASPTPENDAPTVPVTSVLGENSESHLTSEDRVAPVLASTSIPAEESDSNLASTDSTADEVVAVPVPEERSKSDPASEDRAAAEIAAASVPAEKSGGAASEDSAAPRDAPDSVPAERSESNRASENSAAVETAAASVPAETSDSNAGSEIRGTAKVIATADPAERSKPADIAMVGAPQLPEPFSQQPKQADPMSRSKPGLAGGKAGSIRIPENVKKGNQPKVARTLVGLVAAQGSDLLNAPPQEQREPHGYITVESKPEPPRIATDRNRSLKRPDHPPKKEDYPAEPQDTAPQTQDYPPERPQDYASKHRDSSPKRGDESGDLQRFASDFVQTNQTGNVADQHRFYADSVHFYGEGDLSWAGVAAATQRYHQQKQNRQYGAAAPAVVKGPVNGGFYVVDQPVSWSRTDGSRSTRGRSLLRLRVVPTGRGGWKITSIEEVGQ